MGEQCLRRWHGIRACYTALVRSETIINFIGDGLGIHWPQLDEDISVEGILAGRRSHERKESFEQCLASRRRAT